MVGMKIRVPYDRIVQIAKSDGLLFVRRKRRKPVLEKPRSAFLEAARGEGSCDCLQS